MKHILVAPLGRLLYSWIAGLLCLHYFPNLPSNYFLYTGISLLFLALLLEVIPFRFREKATYFTWVWPWLLPFCFSIGLVKFHDERIRPAHYSHRIGNKLDALVVVEAPPQRKSKSIKLTVRCKALYENGIIKPLSGKLYVYLTSKDSHNKKFIPGQLYRMALQCEPFPDNRIPGAFDYAQYAARQQVYARAFVKATHCRLVQDAQPGLPFWQFQITEFLKNRLAVALKNPDELGIAEALLFGARNDIDQELWQAYSRSGIVHLVAISGMHLGMIYATLLYLFSFLPGKRKTALMPALLCLWIFAIITGLPASVLRAACMFTLLGMAEWFNKNNYPINTLYASAFILLVLDPALLFDIGFQLSYLAVGGLILFQAPILNGLATKFPVIPLNLLELIAGTLAAQILSTPCILFWFHQLPLLVVFTNLLAVPWSTLIIYSEIIWVALAPLPFNFHFVGNFISWAIQWLNGLAIWVSAQSISVWETNTWTILEVITLYLLLYAGYRFLNKRRVVFAVLGLSSISCLLLISTLQLYSSKQKAGLLVYTRNKEPVLQIFEDNRTMFFPPKIAPDLWNYQIKPALHSLYIDTNQTSPCIQWHRDGFHFFASKLTRVVFLEKPYALIKPIPVDYLVLTYKVPLGAWLHTWQAKQIISCSTQTESIPETINKMAIKQLKANDAALFFTSP